jgi:hypothetical protein
LRANLFSASMYFFKHFWSLATWMHDAHSTVHRMLLNAPNIRNSCVSYTISVYFFLSSIYCFLRFMIQHLDGNFIWNHTIIFSSSPNFTP